MDEPHQIMPPLESASGSDDVTSSASGRRFVTIDELATITTLSASTIRRLYKRGLIVGYQPGGHRTRIVFPLDAVEKVAAAGSDNSDVSTHKPKSRGPRPKWFDHE